MGPATNKWLLESASSELDDVRGKIRGMRIRGTYGAKDMEFLEQREEFLEKVVAELSEGSEEE